MDVKLAIFLTPLACALAHPVKSEETQEPTPEIVVTGTVIQSTQMLEIVPKHSFDRERIESVYPSTVADLLRAIPGISVTQQGGEGGVAFVSVGGADPNHTVVMIDGIKVDDPTNDRGGGYDFSGLDPLMVERVDTYYGSYSPVYGSDALAGVISITTRGNSRLRSVASTLELGTNGAWSAAAGVSGIPITDSIIAGVNVVKRQSSKAIDGVDINREQVALRLDNGAVDSHVDWSLGLFLSDSDASGYPSASGGDQLAVIRDTETRNSEQFTARAKVAWAPRQNWDSTLVAGWAVHDDVNDSPGISPGVLSGVPSVQKDSRYERGAFTWSNTVRVSERMSLGIGAEAIREDGEFRSLIDFGIVVPAQFSLRRTTLSAFGEVSYKVSEPLTVVAGLRHDDLESGSATNGRLALNIDLPGSGRNATLSYSEGFKLPSMFALGHSITGNPNLLPETSKSFALQIRQSLAGDRIRSTIDVFHNDFANLVDFDFDTFTHVNRSRANTRGVNLSVDVMVNEHLSFAGTIGYLDAKLTDGTKLENRPRWTSQLSLQWQPVNDLRFSINAYAKDGFFDTSVPTGERMLAGYARTDARVFWAISEKVSIRFLVDNLFDRKYEENVGFSAHTREARLAFSVGL